MYPYLVRFHLVIQAQTDLRSNSNNLVPMVSSIRPV